MHVSPEMYASGSPPRPARDDRLSNILLGARFISRRRAVAASGWGIRTVSEYFCGGTFVQERFVQFIPLPDPRPPLPRSR